MPVHQTVAADPVLLALDDGIATLTLDRPHKLNALDYATIDRLMAHLDAIEVEPAARAVILTGAGDRAFSAGGDIHEFSKSVACGPNAAIRDFVRRGQGLTARIEAFPKPVIVAVNGLAFGGGCEITEAAHLAVASDRALFAKPEIMLGMPPTFGGTQRLARLAGRKRALALLLTGERFTAEQALALGLVNAVVPHDDLLPATRDLAARIVRHSPLAVAAIITAVTRGLNMGIAEGLQVEAEQFARMVPTDDLAEGLAAWTERRQPVYAGR
ncbi:crotonase/enoyl-CoA hydratase family protein [Rhodoplanes roseus]|uniref:Enoyl-CoA hydratase n=1 Tax=Rhodoplanes roseus TaxID=29409 RepID=A0A327KQS5_9BRAD|nr:crotonase/enoyl-CoA hydratase family protein [Rhodoplanes roseus]RAI41239.1 enoyl-CoA hydratase [Rhodoplanes roseus]